LIKSILAREEEGEEGEEVLLPRRLPPRGAREVLLGLLFPLLAAVASAQHKKGGALFVSKSGADADADADALLAAAREGA